MKRKTGNTDFIEGRVTISSLVTDHIFTKALAKRLRQLRYKRKKSGRDYN